MGCPEFAVRPSLNRRYKQYKLYGITAAHGFFEGIFITTQPTYISVPFDHSLPQLPLRI